MSLDLGMMSVEYKGTEATAHILVGRMWAHKGWAAHTKPTQTLFQ